MILYIIYYNPAKVEVSVIPVTNDNFQHFEDTENECYNLFIHSKDERTYAESWVGDEDDEDEELYNISLPLDVKRDASDVDIYQFKKLIEESDDNFVEIYINAKRIKLTTGGNDLTSI